MIAHLVESTLLLGVAVAAAHLPRLAGRTRYAIVFLALVKFAIPSSLVTNLRPAGMISISIPGSLAVTPHAFAAPSIWPAVVKAIWLAVAAALFLIILLRARRAMADALDGAAPAPERETAILRRLRGDVVLLRSPTALAPAAIGILHPRIVLPADLDLGDDELEAILAHECTHIARRDNLLALADAFAGAALWFHPLVWMARRILARAREDACDEVVVARGGPDVYLTALAKVCRAAVAPRVAGVSCVVSNTIRERMNAIMTFPLRRHLSHRLVVAAAVALLAAATLVQAQDGKAKRYAMQIATTVAGNGDTIFDITVRDRVTNEVVAHPKVRMAAGVPAEITTDGTPQFRISARGETDGSASVVVQAYDANGELLESSTAMCTVKKATPSTSSSPSSNISLQLKDADLKDVVRVFGQLTGLDPKIDAGVEGRVTVDLHEVPWEQALQQILAENHCDYLVDGTTLHVRRLP